MHPGIPRLIRCDDLEPGFGRSGGRRGPALELARRSGVLQGELFQEPVPFDPLSPYLEFVRIPETSGSEGAPSEHLDFRPDPDLFPLLQDPAAGRSKDVHDEPRKFDDDPFPGDIPPGDQGDGLGALLDRLGKGEGGPPRGFRPGSAFPAGFPPGKGPPRGARKRFFPLWRGWTMMRSVSPVPPSCFPAIRVSPVSTLTILTAAPPTPVPITLASLETTRTRTFVGMAWPQKASRAKRDIPATTKGIKPFRNIRPPPGFKVQ